MVEMLGLGLVEIRLIVLIVVVVLNRVVCGFFMILICLRLNRF